MPPKPKSSKKKKQLKQADYSSDIPIQLKLSKQTSLSRKEEFQNKLEESISLVLMAIFRKRRGTLDNFVLNESEGFPTLQVGYLARIVGMNITNSQMIDIVRLSETDEQSSGVVQLDRLRLVLTDAYMTGMIGGPTLFESGMIPRAREKEVIPSCCIREDERHIFRAFFSLDVAGKGYLTEDELRVPMISLGESFSDAEMEEMLTASVDHETRRIYYKNFADILAHE